MRNFLLNVKAFLHGMVEFRSDCTARYDGDQYYTYDEGREFAHRITFRKWDDR